MLALSVTSGPVMAHDVYLVARKLNKPMPDGSTVAMWGFAPDSDSNLATIEADPATVPGPVITVPEGDTTLRVHLRNELAVPVSIVIPGLPAAPAPTWVEPDGTELKGSRGGSVTARLRSMAAEAAPKSQSNPAGGTALYEWTNVTSGTYLYHSGTDPQI
ncbi:MAG: hypothetical protein K2Q10_07375, partial [Rhodospirillales bacterium]|nr:hypothetical protein [Rhodospirillales bacterium]